MKRGGLESTASRQPGPSLLPPVFGLGRLMGAHQEHGGHSVIEVMYDLDEAWRFLGAK
jgi:hypothetical protein